MATDLKKNLSSPSAKYCLLQESNKDVEPTGAVNE